MFLIEFVLWNDTFRKLQIVIPDASAGSSLMYRVGLPNAIWNNNMDTYNTQP